MSTGIVEDRRYAEHDMGPGHPESPQRIEAINKMLEEEKIFSAYTLIEPRLAEEEEIELIHHPSYFEKIKKTSGKQRVYLDPDTSTSARSYETALLAAGGLMKAADMIMEQKIRNGFALVRPPGHHAEASEARGFCLFNNVAIAAQYLIEKYGLKRVLIVDWDLHHGNGTQHSFYSRSDVLYFSTHQFPHYPGTGYWNEVGSGDGEGYTVNVPLSPGKGDEDFIFIFQQILSPITAAYNPEFILVSAGFDIFEGDPLGGMDVSAKGFGALAAELMTMAHATARDRLLFTLEGGYNLTGLADGVKNVLLVLGGKEKVPVKTLRVSASTLEELTPIFKVQGKYWAFKA